MVMMTMVAVMVIAMMSAVMIAVTNMDVLRGAGGVWMTIYFLVLRRNCG